MEIKINIHDLPAEMLLYTLSFISPLTLCNIINVNKSWCIYIRLILADLNKSNKIRNLAIVGPVDVGRTFITDHFLSCASELSKGRLRNDLNSKFSGTSLLYNDPNNGQYLINLINSPRCYDEAPIRFVSAPKITDGAVVVLDCIENSPHQLRDLANQLIRDSIRPVVLVNKLDRLILELQLDYEESYNQIERAIRYFNSNLCQEYSGDNIEEILMDPRKGNVAFGSGKYGWAFTLPQFAKLYAVRLKISEKLFLQRLWDDNYFDPETKKWTHTPISQSGKKLQRSFCQFILSPIYKLIRAIQDENSPNLTQMLTALKISLSEGDMKLPNRDLIKLIMHNFLPIEKALVELTVDHLPSPIESKRHPADKIETVYFSSGHEANNGSFRTRERYY